MSEKEIIEINSNLSECIATIVYTFQSLQQHSTKLKLQKIDKKDFKCVGHVERKSSSIQLTIDEIKKG